MAPGAWLKRYLYDGLGRLIETQSPYLGPGGIIAREEHFFYDGARRIQEVVTDPLDIQAVYLKYGVEGLIELLQNLAAVADQGLQCTKLGKEYVWGPGDGGAAGAHNGADELIAVFDRGWLDANGNIECAWGQPWYVIRDLDGDTVGLVDIRGTGTGPNPTLPTLAAEWQYDAYGQVQWSRANAPHPVIACGHRGVFFDRLDEPVIRFAADAAQGDMEIPAPPLGQTWDTRVLTGPLAAGSGGALNNAYQLPTGKPKLIGHMRNRAYLPHLMRFAQRDPNASGQLVMASIAHSGRALRHSPGLMELTGIYGNGGNLYGYLGGHPRGTTDATGLLFPSLKDVGGALFMAGVRGLRGGLEGIVNQYADNMEDDFDWAMDWSRSDDDYSRRSSKWVGDAFMEGMRAGVRDSINDSLSDWTFGIWPGSDRTSGQPMSADWKEFVRNPVRAVGRIHGGFAHMAKMRSVTARFLKRGISKFDIRHNQALVDAAGKIICLFRPDIQVIDRVNKKVHLIEVIGTHTGTEARKNALLNAARLAYPTFTTIWEEHRLR